MQSSVALIAFFGLLSAVYCDFGKGVATLKLPGSETEWTSHGHTLYVRNILGISSMVYRDEKSATIYIGAEEKDGLTMMTSADVMQQSYKIPLGKLTVISTPDINYVVEQEADRTTVLIAQ